MAALRWQPVDRIPWAPLIDGYFLESLPPAQRMSKIPFLRHIGCDIIDWQLGQHTIYRDVETTTQQRGDDTITTIRTPCGILTERRQRTATTTFITEPKIKSVRDIEPYRFWHEHIYYEPDFATLRQVENEIGDDGMVFACAPQSPAQFLIGEDIGVEGFYYLLADYPHEMEKLLATMHDKNKEAYRLLADSPAAVVLAPEDVSTSTMSPDLCERYTLGYLDDYADIVHAGGKLLIAHMCGLLKDMAPLIARTRLDGIESVTPPTTGNLPVDEARTAWPDKVVIGGLEPKSLAMLPVGDVRAYARDVLRRAAPGNGFVLATGDATAWGTPIENLIAVTETVAAFTV